MTIPATAITIDDTTAWLVVRSITDDLKYGTGRRRTLDVECVLPMCVNGKRGYWQDGHPCGRCRATGTYQLSVHVVEVLPIHDHCADYKPADHICRAWQDERWYWHRSDLGDRPTEEIVTLSTDAAPGMFAVRLAVHT
jgi:hypothetical protein